MANLMPNISEIIAVLKEKEVPPHIIEAINKAIILSVVTRLSQREYFAKKSSLALQTAKMHEGMLDNALNRLGILNRQLIEWKEYNENENDL
jgi:hypothetical protein